MSDKYVGLLLCGGQSSRMKTDKAFLGVPSSTSKATSQSNTTFSRPEDPLVLHLLKNVLDPVDSISQIIISARDEDQQALIGSTIENAIGMHAHISHPVQIMLDDEEFKNKGPASGILTVHKMCPGASLLVLAVDFPKVECEAMTQLIDAHEANGNSPVTCFLHPEDGNPEPVMSIWSPSALDRLAENARKGKSGPCFTAKQIWREISSDGSGMSEGHGLVRPRKKEWVEDADTPEEWERIFGGSPRSLI